MKSKTDRTEAAKTGTPSPRPRFRIDKLEERIAPKGWGKGGKGTNNCATLDCGDTSGSSY